MNILFTFSKNSKSRAFAYFEASCKVTPDKSLFLELPLDGDVFFLFSPVVAPVVVLCDVGGGGGGAVVTDGDACCCWVALDGAIGLGIF